ncbi:MAG: NAD(P)/FAD-dependent oxidoreductase, partial [Candidatus Methanomethylophilaceae archaeon]|nr:NAD(P)/FAD-dependent oxidoreductase [Candidatus Methanomethylophilaceae archaeon]
MTYDAVVAGAGPAGTMSARILASRGYGIKVLEDDPVSGKPVQCAGLVSERVLGMSGVKPEVFGRFYGAEVIFPDGSSVIARSRNVKAVAIDRGDFDRRMADAAADAGAEFSYGSKYLSHESGGDGVSVISASGTDRCRAVIGADGYGSRVARSLSGNLPREYVYGAQYDLKNKAGSQDIFRVRMGNGCAPGFFLWEIPCGDFTRVGLCVSAGKGYPFGYLNAMVRKFYPDSGIIARYGGKIPLGGRRTTYGERCLLIGDAAGQVKPVSGGGIYPSLVSAGILADVLSDALDSGDLSAGRLSRYE